MPLLSLIPLYLCERVKCNCIHLCRILITNRKWFEFAYAHRHMLERLGEATLNANMSGHSVASGLHDVKGKGRATETTPLLQPQIPSADAPIVGGSLACYHAVPSPPPSPSPRQCRADLWNILVKVFFGTLTLCIVGVVLVTLLIWSYAWWAEGAGTDKALRAITWHGPQDIEVLGVGEEGKGGGKGAILLWCVYLGVLVIVRA